LFRQQYNFAMTIAMRYSRDKQDAADIMSLAFVKVFKSIASFDESKGIFQSWLKRIIINEALDHIKQRNRFINRELTANEEPVINNNVVEKIDAAEIMQMVKQLPPATHAVFLLYAVDGYSHKEIAKQLKISEGTSKWHLSEARKKLQQNLTSINYT
jgi:RNA polymerase sigma factor (sigma-70 family)